MRAVVTVTMRRRAGSSRSEVRSATFPLRSGARGASPGAAWLELGALALAAIAAEGPGEVPVVAAGVGDERLHARAQSAAAIEMTRAH